MLSWNCCSLASVNLLVISSEAAADNLKNSSFLFWNCVFIFFFCVLLSFFIIYFELECLALLLFAINKQKGKSSSYFNFVIVFFIFLSNSFERILSFVSFLFYSSLKPIRFVKNLDRARISVLLVEF